MLIFCKRDPLQMKPGHFITREWRLSLYNECLCQKPQPSPSGDSEPHRVINLDPREKHADPREKHADPALPQLNI